jgi:peptide chain release factor
MSCVKPFFGLFSRTTLSEIDAGIQTKLTMISADKEQGLRARMARAGIREEDVVEQFVKGSGPGGQKINKTSSCVQILHRPTGIEIKCQLGRSQAHNRLLARLELCRRVEARLQAAEAARRDAAERARRQSRRRSRTQRAIMLDGKRRHAQKKAQRRHADWDG